MNMVKTVAVVLGLLFVATSQSEAAWLRWTEWNELSSVKPLRTSVSIDAAFETQAECRASFDERRDGLTKVFGEVYRETSRTVGGIRFKGQKRNEGADETAMLNLSFSCWPVGVELTTDEGHMVKPRPVK